LKRISHVLLSNDPIARGHTCRILGLMASEAMESSEILVKIQSRVMETHHLFELTCSIYALDKICRISKHDVTEKLYLRITQVETPIRIKIQLIRILRHSPTMETVTKLYKLAVMYPSTPILSVILSVLGYVTRQSILVAKSVFEFFTLLLEEEARHLVKKQILLEMYAIVKQSPGSFVKYLDLSLLLENVSVESWNILCLISEYLTDVNNVVAQLQHDDPSIRLKSCECLLVWSRFHKSTLYEKDILLGICLGSKDKYIGYLVQLYVNVFHRGFQELYSLCIQWIQKGQLHHWKTLTKLTATKDWNFDIHPFLTLSITNPSLYFKCLFQITNKAEVIKSVFEKCKSDSWNLYVFAQMAMLAQQYDIAEEALVLVSTKIKKSVFLFWIHGLISLCRRNPSVDNFVCWSHHTNHTFPAQYCHWRLKYSNVLLQLDSIGFHPTFPRNKVQLIKMKSELEEMNRNYNVFCHSWIDMDQSSCDVLRSELDYYTSLVSNNPMERPCFMIPKYIFVTHTCTKLVLEIEIEKKQYTNQIIHSNVGNGLVLNISGYIKYQGVPLRKCTSVSVQVEYATTVTTLSTPIINSGFTNRTMCRFDTPGNHFIHVSCRLVDLDQNTFYTNIKQSIKVLSKME
jgi:hypothetical protein